MNSTNSINSCTKTTFHHGDMFQVLFLENLIYLPLSLYHCYSIEKPLPLRYS